MTGIKWAHERELTTTLGGEAEGGGRLADAYGTEASLQLDDSLFSRSERGTAFGRGNQFGTESHFRSSDLMFDFGDDPQEADEDKGEKNKEGEKPTGKKDEEKSGKGDSPSPVDGVAATMAETSLTAGQKEGSE